MTPGGGAEISGGLPESIDSLFKANAIRDPGALALADPPDRASWSSGAPRRLTYAEADRAIGALASRLQSIGLPPQSVIAYQLPNCVENVLTLIAILRAGFVPAPLPLLWRQADMATALAGAGAKALITMDRVGATRMVDVAMQAAAEAFCVRFVCGFGDAGDGIVPLDDVLAGAGGAHSDCADDLATNLALVTFDVTASGMIPTWRSHAQIIGSGRLAAAEAGLEDGDCILGALTLGSFSTIAATIIPWLLSGGRLALHQPFAADLLKRQIAAEGAALAIIPGLLVRPAAAAGLFGDGQLRAILGLWRAPERLWANGAVLVDGVELVDVLAFGEAGLLALRRGADGAPPIIPARSLDVPGCGKPAFIRVGRTASGTLGFGGPLVPEAGAMMNGGRRIEAITSAAPSDELVDTSYPCRLDRKSNAFVITGPPAGIVNVGGYRFAARELETMVRGVDDGAAIAALPDAWTGYRLAGTGANRSTMREALFAIGANPLVEFAFRERKARHTSDAA